MNRYFIFFFSLSVLFFAQCLSAQNVSQEITIAKHQGKKYELSFYTTDSTRVSFNYFRDKEGGFLYSRRNAKKVRWTVSRQNEKWIKHSISGEVIKKAHSVDISLFVRKDSLAFKDFVFKIENDTTNLLKNPMLKVDNGIIPQWEINGLDIFQNLEQDGIQTYFSDFTRSRKLYGNNKEVGKYVDIDDVSLYYEIYGEGEPLLLLHGNNESISSFASQIYELSKYYQVIAMDSRCQGKSSFSKKEMTYELMAKDTKAFLEYLNLDKVHVLGWSDGGNTGLIMSMRYPEKIKSLITSGAVLFPGTEAVVKKEWRGFKMGYRIARFVSVFNRKYRKELHVARMLFHYPQIAPEDLHVIRTPVLITSGENDIVLKNHTTLIVNNIEGAQLSILEGADHYAPANQSKVFNAIVLKFLQSIN